MKRWRIPVRIVEIGRTAIIEAETKAEALRLFRERAWQELTDTDIVIVTKAGRIEEDKCEEGTPVVPAVASAAWSYYDDAADAMCVVYRFDNGRFLHCRYQGSLKVWGARV